MILKLIIWALILVLILFMVYKSVGIIKDILRQEIKDDIDEEIKDREFLNTQGRRVTKHLNRNEFEGKDIEESKGIIDNFIKKENK